MYTGTDTKRKYSLPLTLFVGGILAWLAWGELTKGCKVARTRMDCIGYFATDWFTLNFLSPNPIDNQHKTGGEGGGNLLNQQVKICIL